VETGEDTEVKTEKMYVEENPFTIKSKTVEAQALIQIQVLILAPRMTNKSVAKNRSSLKKWLSMSKKNHVTVLFVYPQNAVSNQKDQIPFQVITAKVKTHQIPP
jgi:hypothetical protein